MYNVCPMCNKPWLRIILPPPPAQGPGSQLGEPAGKIFY